ncbi:MAG TPA: hypothetical protein PKK61_05545 [Defluviitaleaceae bacterium]|nr:hypothetical protein [Defluviitaleaceae bacterium]
MRITTVKDMLDENMDIELIFKCEFDEYGLATIRKVGNNFVTTMYQNRLNLDLETDEEIIKELGEGNSFGGSYSDLNQAMCECFSFWRLKDKVTINSDRVIPVFSSYKEAAKYLKEIDEKFMICIIN